MVQLNKLETGNFHEHEKTATMSNEKTVSLLLRGINGHTQLTHSGNPYGVCLAHALQERGALLAGQTVLMIGDGLGYNSSQLHETTGRQGLNIEYIGFDLSPILRQQQQKQNPWQTILEGNALSLASIQLPKQPQGLLLNEVIADFPVIEVDDALLSHLIALVASGNPISRNVLGDIYKRFEIAKPVHLLELLNLLQSYDFVYPRRNNNSSLIINIGAVHFLEQSARVLSPGGWVWMSEYGFDNPNGYCQGAWTQDQQNEKGHQEWTIDFYLLSQVAKKLGFKVVLEKLNNVIGIRNNEFAAVGFIEDDGETETLGPDYEPIFYSFEEVLRYYSSLLTLDRPILPSVSQRLLKSINSSPTLLHEFSRWIQAQIKQYNRIAFSRDLLEGDLEKTIGIKFERVGNFTDDFYSLLLIKE